VCVCVFSIHLNLPNDILDDYTANEVCVTVSVECLFVSSCVEM